MKVKPKARRLSRPKAKLTVQRLDGVGHWREMLDQMLWMLLRAGVAAGDIEDATRKILVERRKTRALSMPRPEVLEYSRMLTYWRTEPQFLNEMGSPQSLPLSSGSASFRALVRLALPESKAADVLRVLRQYEVVDVDSRKRVTLRTITLLPRNKRRAEFLAHSLSALEGILNTCYTNLTAPLRANVIGLLQRVAIAERFDMRFIEEYKVFLRDQATEFLLNQDAWLKRHEIKEGSGRQTNSAHVGVGVFGFRAR